MLNIVGSWAGKEGFSPLRINSFPGRKGLERANKPATESTVTQGRQETSNPSRSDVKPPVRLEPALSPVSLVG